MAGSRCRRPRPPSASRRDVSPLVAPLAGRDPPGSRVAVVSVRSLQPSASLASGHSRPSSPRRSAPAATSRLRAAPGRRRYRLLPSTVSKVLWRAGLSRPPMPRTGPTNLYEWPCPSDLLHMDTSAYARFQLLCLRVTGDLSYPGPPAPPRRRLLARYPPLPLPSLLRLYPPLPSNPHPPPLPPPLSPLLLLIRQHAPNVYSPTTPLFFSPTAPRAYYSLPLPHLHTPPSPPLTHPLFFLFLFSFSLFFSFFLSYFSISLSSFLFLSFSFFFSLCTLLLLPLLPASFSVRRR